MWKKQRLLPGVMIFPLILAVVFNMAAYYIPRLVTGNRIHYDLSVYLDRQIPFLPWTIVIYLGSYFFWAANYIIGCRQEESQAFLFISADFAAKAVCFLCFLLFPTTNVRPVIEGSSIWDQLMILLYRADAADNLLPSIHCLTSWFSFIAVRNNPRIPPWYRFTSLLAAAAICISTLTTKQHVLADVFTGILLAEGSIVFSKKSGFSRFYENLMRKIYH